MRRKMLITLAVVGLAGLILATAGPVEAKRGGEGGRGNGPIIFVTSQNLYFDSIVTADPVPPHGPFQRLYMGANGLTTDAGPGDSGYVGGRWWMDVDGGGQMDDGDHYFVCPLLPPGREAP